MNDYIKGTLFTVAFALALASFLGYIASEQSKANFATCDKYLPNGFTTIEAYPLLADFRCDYESLPDLPYKVCSKTLSETKNHGYIVIEDTCDERPRNIFGDYK